MTPAEQGTAVAGWSRFPLLAKFLFTAEKLSVQLHPDNSYAQQHEGEPWGKSEMWYVIDAAAGAWVRVGFDPGFTRARLQPLLGTAGVEEALNSVPVRGGDAVYVPAGTLHSIGPGLILCEIQQYSDVTYRVYDYDRPGLDGRRRPLQLEQALAAVRLETPEAGRRTPVQLPAGRGQGQLVVASPHFVVEKYETQKPFEIFSEPVHFSLLIFCAGAGRLGSGTLPFPYQKGDAFLVSANSPVLEVAPAEPSLWLRAYPVG